MQVVLEWKPNKIPKEGGAEWEMVDDPNDNPPPVVWLRVRAWASAGAISDITRKHRQADKETATASVTDGETVTDDDAKSANATTKLMLIPVATGRQKRVLGPECALKATGDLAGGRKESAQTSTGEWDGWLFLDGTVSAGASYDAAIDNRGVCITRPGARGEFYNALTNTTYGHSTYSYVSESVDAEGFTWYTNFPNNQNFKAAYNSTGEGNQALDWYQWNPSDPSDTWESHTQEMPYGNPYRVSGSDEWHGQATIGPQKKIIGYTAYHADGATVNARYELILHDEYEKRTHRIDDEFENPRRVGDNAIGPCVPELSRGTEYSYSVAASASGRLSRWIAKLIPVNLELSATKTSSTTTTIVAVDPVPAGQYTWFELKDHYHYHRGMADKWDSAGYVDEEAYEIKEVPSDPSDRYGIQIHTPYQPYSGGGGQNGG